MKIKFEKFIFNFVWLLTNHTYKFVLVLVNGLLFVGFIMVFFYAWNVGYFEIISWETYFMDPSSSFSESLVRLYNFVWAFLFFVLFFVLVLMFRIVYLFLWKPFFINNRIINFVSYYFYKLNIFFSIIVNDFNLIFSSSKNFLKLSSSNIFNLNFWYSKFKKDEFLNISDLSEYKHLETTWCLLPACGLVTLVGPSFSLVYALDPYVDPTITIKVVGHQWFWSYELSGVYSVNPNSEHYKKTDLYKLVEPVISKLKKKSLLQVVNYKEIEYVLNNLHFNRSVVHYDIKFDSVMVSENELKEGTHRLLEVDNKIIVPVGFPIRFIITSSDVLHSWSLPSLGIKVDAVPGRLNQFVTEIKKPGIFYGQCSELCGPLHGFMPIVIQSVSDKEFENWLFANIK